MSWIQWHWGYPRHRCWCSVITHRNLLLRFFEDLPPEPDCSGLGTCSSSSSLCPLYDNTSWASLSTSTSSGSTGGRVWTFAWEYVYPVVSHGPIFRANTSSADHRLAVRRSDFVRVTCLKRSAGASADAALAAFHRGCGPHPVDELVQSVRVANSVVEGRMPRVAWNLDTPNAMKENTTHHTEKPGRKYSNRPSSMAGWVRGISLDIWPLSQNGSFPIKIKTPEPEEKQKH